MPYKFYRKKKAYIQPRKVISKSRPAVIGGSTSRSIRVRRTKIVPSYNAVKSIVRKQIARTQEIKQNLSIVSNTTPSSPTFLPIESYLNDPTCNLRNLLEPLGLINQGTGQGDRIGNQINIKALILRGYLYAIDGGFTGGVPTNVTMYIGKLKGTTTAPSPAQFLNLYQAGNGTYPPTDTNINALWSINKDLFTVFYKRTFKIGGSLAATTGYVSNNDYKALQYFRVNLTKYIPSILRYNDSGTQAPSNAGLYLWFTVANYNDTPIGTGYIPQVQYTALSKAFWTD